MAITRTADKINKSVQEMNNLSFDTDRNVLAREALTVNPVSGNSEVATAIQGNASLSLTQSDSVVASSQVLTKTVGSTSYTRTLTRNANGDLLSITPWS